jgi:hypothetical protein
MGAKCCFIRRDLSLGEISVSLERPLFRLRIAQTMPYLGQCGAIATGGDMPIDL